MIARPYRLVALLTVELTISLTAAGCGPKVQHVPIGPRYPPESPDAAISVLSIRAPECPFDEIAVVTASEDWPFIGAEDVLEGFRTAARAMGGHALVGLQPVERHGKFTTWSATVIHFTDPECQRK